jgi:branched-chain amino acid transport system ATP-binding protein
LDKPLLEVEGLSVRYGQAAALLDVSLTMTRGERVILLGRNGAGKTTLLNALTGLAPPSQGTVLLDGESILGRAPHQIARRGVAHVSEGRRVFPTMSVADNLLSGGGWIAARRRKELLSQTVDLFPKLGDRFRQTAGTLSGGERQMLLIGRGLMLDPALLLLDEASQGLAPVVVDELLAAVERISEFGVATLVVEQNTRVLELSGRVVILNTGRVAFSGHSTDPNILDRVKSAYLDEAPVEATSSGS